MGGSIFLTLFFGLFLAIGLGILGAAAARRDRYYYDDADYCYRGRERCHWEGRRCFENRYGDTVCRGGDYVCRRPLICD